MLPPFIAEKREEIAEICRVHHVKRLSVFGSAVRDDFDPARSDIDLLVQFEPEIPGRYTENYFSLRESFVRLLHRDVDVVREGTIKNPYRLKSINEDVQGVYAA